MMATDTAPAAVPGPPEPPSGTPATQAGDQKPAKGFLAAMVAPVEPARATFDLAPTTGSTAHPDASDGVLDRSAPGKSSASFYDTEQAAGKDPAGSSRKAQGSIWKAWWLAGAQRWAKGGGTANKRLDMKKAQAQANQVKEARTTTVTKSGGLLPVRNSGGSGAGPKGNSGKSGGHSGTKGPVNSAGNRSGGAGRGGSGGGGRGPGGGAGHNGSSSGGRGKDAAGHGKGPGSKGPASDRTSGGKGAGGAGGGHGTGSPGKNTHGGKDTSGRDPKSPKRADGKGPGKSPAGGGSAGAPGSSGSGKQGPAGKGGPAGKDGGKTGGTGTAGGSGTGGASNTGTAKTDAKPNTKHGKDDTARKPKHDKGQPDTRTPLEKSRETGHKDGSTVRNVVDHVKAYKDGAVDGYRDKRDENAREHTRLDKAHDQHKPKPRTQGDTTTKAGRPQPVIVTEQEDDGVTTDVKPLTVKSIDANTLTLGADATRATYGRRELRNFKQYERKLETKETNLQKIAEACKQLQKEAEKEEKDCQDLLEQAKSVEGGEKLVGKLTKLADAAKNQATEAAELAKQAKRAAEMCKVVLTNIQTRYEPLYKAVVDSDETKPAELRFYNDKGSYAPAA